VELTSGVRFVTLPYDSSLRLPPIDLAKRVQTGVDFADAASERVLAMTAREVARELGREAAREYFAELVCGTKDSVA
jgi:hypothetical protein